MISNTIAATAAIAGAQVNADAPVICVNVSLFICETEITPQCTGLNHKEHKFVPGLRNSDLAKPCFKIKKKLKEGMQRESSVHRTGVNP